MKKFITVPLLVSKCIDYYNLEGNLNGGNFHIVLEDNNIEKKHIQFCINVCKLTNDLPGLELGELLLAASKTQLKKLVKSYEYGYFGHNRSYEYIK